MDKQDFEQMIKQHVRLPSMGIADKIYSAFDIEDCGRIDAREVRFEIRFEMIEVKILR